MGGGREGIKEKNGFYAAYVQLASEFSGFSSILNSNLKLDERVHNLHMIVSSDTIKYG